MDRKVFALPTDALVDDGAGSFAGYASLFGVLDSQGDIVVKGAYRETLPQFLERGFISWAHRWDTPVATIREAREDDRGLYVLADFHSDPESQMARTRTRERLERGKFMGLSIGYETVDHEITGSARFLKKVDLFETGLVTVPALRDAGVTDAKADDPDLKPFAGEHSCRLRPPDRYDRLRRGEREHEGKTYGIIFGHPKGGGGWEEQSYRYKVEEGWTEAQARSHCSDHDGILFEPAKEKSAGETFADHADRVLADVVAFLQRAAALNALRTKEGRVLSAANRDKLARHVEALAALCTEMDELLRATEPPEKAARAATELARLRFDTDRLLARVRLQGVSV